MAALLVFSCPLVVQANPATQEAPDAARTYQSTRAELDGTAVPRLIELARESEHRRFYGLADSLYKAVLELEPDNPRARRALRYHRVRTGTWVQSRGYKQRNDRAKPSQAPWREEVQTELRDYRNRALILIDGARNELGLAGVEGELHSLLAINPDDEVVRATLGEELFEDHWMLNESVRAMKRRRAFPGLARACIEQAPEPWEGTLRDEELALPLQWLGVRETEDVRVVTSVGLGEAQHTARVTHAVGDYFRLVFAAQRALRNDYTVYLLNPTGKAPLIGSWPGLDQSTIGGLSSAEGGWLGTGNRLAEWSGNPARRLDGAARQTLGTLLMDTYGIDGRHGWAWEGVGLYMVRHLLGTRLTWFFDTSGYQPQTATGLWSRLQSPESNWLAEAEALLSSENSLRLSYLLGRKINAMREQDVLHAYAFAAYLLEGSPREVPTILRRIGAGDHPTAVIESELGYSLPTVEVRFRRWLREVR